MAVAVDAAPSENGGAAAGAGAAQSAAITYASGSVIVFMVSVLANRTVSNPSDSNGLTWNSLVNNLSFTANARVVYSWWAYAATGGTTTISADISGSGTPTWMTQRMSATGVDSTTPLDTSDNTQGGPSLSSPQESAASLTTVSDALIFAFWSSTSRTYSADTGNGYTIATSITTAPFQYKVGSASAETVSFTWTTGTVAYAAIAVSLKAAAAAGGMIHRRRRAGSTLFRM